MITLKHIAKSVKAKLVRANQPRVDINVLEKALEESFDELVDSLKGGERFRFGRFGILKITLKKARKVVDNLGTYEGIKMLPQRPTITLVKNKNLEKDLLSSFDKSKSETQKVEQTIQDLKDDQH